MIVNLTPHPLNIYPYDTPDHICSGDVLPIRVLPPSVQHQPARLGSQVIGEERIDDAIPVMRVAFGPGNGRFSDLPDPVPGTWYVVSLVVGFAAAHRDDLLVLHQYVRDMDGRIIGSRALARPATAAAAPAHPSERAVTAVTATPGKAKPWCNYSVHRTTSPRRGSGGRTNKTPHGVSKRRWRRRRYDWWRQQQFPPAGPCSPSHP
ncbi:hypothetical protein ACN27G_29055 [Plantactinospora sp. WMMB334]|uniref:hypothetical protein n=1 Tax=Plantactinospora sp. WMMB334 TaxID=3404119 RepID=UPI003B92F61D